MLFLYGFFVIALSSSALANTHGVRIDGAWIRFLPAGSQSTALYAEIKNESNSGLSLVHVDCPTLAARSMLHKSEHQNGIVVMKHQAQISIPKKSHISLAPGGLHVMFSAVKTLRLGDSHRCFFDFKNSKRIEVTAIVKS
jgi:copper(I)-binding protein